MKTNKNLFGLPTLSRRLRARRGDRKGVALITSLIFLGVAMLLGLSIMLTTSSDVFISGTVRNSKTAFYAADAGVSVMRNALANALNAATPTNLTSGTGPVLMNCPNDGTDPITAGILATALGNAGNGASQSISSYSSSGDIPATYAIDNTNVAGNPRTWLRCTNMQTSQSGSPSTSPWNELYTFAYQITSNGAVPGGAGSLAASTVVEKGTITYNINVVVNSSQTTTPWQSLLFNFSGYGMFIDHANPHVDGLTLAHGNVSGPVHTNGEWGFTPGTSPAYLFTDPVSSVNQNGYWFFYGVGSSPAFDVNANSDSYRYNGTTTTIAPNFMAGYNRGVQNVPIPGNSNNQAGAVIDGRGFDPNNIVDSNGNPVMEPAPTNSQLAAILVNANGNSYSSGVNGVYIPATYTVDSHGNRTNFTTTGAGMYINGDVGSMVLNANTPGLQIYTITQGATTTTVTYNLTQGTVSGHPGQSTTISNGSHSITAAGLPTNLSPVNPSRSAQPAASASIYVNGNINSLSGPTSGAASQDGMAMTITSAGDITITGNMTYHSIPVTETQGQNAPGVPANSPPGTLIPGNDNGQAFGIYTANGNIYLNVGGIPSRSIEVDASMAAMGASGTNGITIGNYTVPNSITLVGGRIQSEAMSIGQVGVTTRNVLFDRRYANSAYAPPFFPATNRGVVTGSTTTTSYTYAVNPLGLPAVSATSYSVPSRLVDAANAGH